MRRLAGLTTLLVLAFAAPASAADSGTPVSATEGANFQGQVASFSGMGTASQDSATIDWGDGSNASTGTITSQPAGFTVSGSHTYTDEGSYKVTVTITPNPQGGANETLTPTATVADANLSGKGTAFSATAGSPFNGQVATFDDTNPSAAVGDFTATINWGDGTTSQGVIGDVASGGLNVSGAHTYAQGGIFNVSTNLTDDGGSVISLMANATVGAAPGPSAQCPAPHPAAHPVPEPGAVAGADPNTRFVQALYRDLLGRAAPAPPSELGVWLSAMEGGTTPGQVAQIFLGSTEYLNHLVSGWYQMFLRRSADPTGVTMFTNALQHGARDEDVIAQLVGSPEYFQVCSSSNKQTWIDTAYQDLLGRSPSSPEFTFWLNSLGGGSTRTQVATAMLDSAERRQSLVNSFYHSFLDRSADPGSMTLVNLLGMGGTDEQVLQAILSSMEFAHDFGAGTDISGMPHVDPRGVVAITLAHPADIHLLILSPGALHVLPRVAALPQAKSVKVVGTVSLGHVRAGRHKLHWNLRVRGRRLKRGTYLIIVQAGSRGHVSDISAPLTLKVR